MSFLAHLAQAQLEAKQGPKPAKAAVRAQPKARPEPAKPAPLPEGFEAVESSNIRAMRWEPSAQWTTEISKDPLDHVGHAFIMFHSAAIWRYGYLRLRDYQALRDAKKPDGVTPNIGKHFHKAIKAQVARGALSAKLMTP